MNKLLKQIGGILTLTLLLSSSCNPPAYIPNMVNTPVFTGDKELIANIGAGTSGGETQVAYSFSNHIGVMINGSFSDYNEFSDDEIFHKHNFVEFGAGYFKPSNFSVFELYGGFGFGEIYDRFNGDEMSRAITKRVFFQPNISAFNNHFEISFAPRISFVNINTGETISGDYDLFIEPTITGRAGFKYLKLFVQSGNIISTGSTELPYKFKSRIFVIGLQLHLGKLVKQDE